jgi:hypothetical protein
VIASATAAAATISTAIAAVSIVMPVASLVTSRSRRALKAGCRADMVGIASRGPTDIGRLSLDTSAHQTHADNPFSETSDYLRLFRSSSDEGSHEHDKAGC